MAYQRDPRFDGIGFMMHAEAGLIGVDLDTVRRHRRLDRAVGAGDRPPVRRRLLGAQHLGHRPPGLLSRHLPVGELPVQDRGVQRRAVRRRALPGGHGSGGARHDRDAAPPLPELQNAVDALHGGLTAGRARATGTAVATGLTGPGDRPDRRRARHRRGRHGRALVRHHVRDLAPRRAGRRRRQ